MEERIIEVKEKEIVKEEKPIDISFSKRKSTAKTFKGELIGDLQKVRNDGNKEMEIYIQEKIRSFNRFYPLKIVKNEITILDGWKGKDNIEVYKGFDNDFRILEHIKDKESGEVKERIIEVKKEDLNKILFIIKKMPLNEPYKCYYFAKKLGYEKWKDLWRERKLYFSQYYFPIKVMEALYLINYSGRGTITRLK